MDIGSALPVGASGNDPLGCLADRGVVQPLVALGGHRGHGRHDAPDQVGAAGAGVLVGGVVQRLDQHVDGGVAVHAVPVALLQAAAGVLAARAGGVVVGVLVAAAGHVVAEDTAVPPSQVVAA